MPRHPPPFCPPTMTPLMPMEHVFSLENKEPFPPSDIDDEDTPIPNDARRKRKRLSLVCTYCKRRKIKCDKARPSCSSCVKLGIECQYEAPHWVTTSLQGKTVATSVSKGTDLNSRTRDELYQLIRDQKEELCRLRSQDHINKSYSSEPSMPTSHSELDFSSRPGSSTLLVPSSSSPSTSDDKLLRAHTVDFFKSYTSLSLKSSSHEDHKPLCTMSIHKKDHYQAFFTCYLLLTLKLNSTYIHDLFREDFRSKHADGGSKWLLMLDTKGEDAGLKDAVKRIVADRARLFRISTFPFQSIDDSMDKNVDLLKNMVINLMPPQYILNSYIEYYCAYMWHHRPYMEKDLFMADIDRIMKRDPTSGAIDLNITQRSDFAILATLLIILRYSYISMMLVDPEKMEPEFKKTREFEIPVTFITTAETCLCFYKIARKTTLPIIQAFLLLRAYHRDAPEDGDGITLFQSQNLYGFILQSALQMGLNRDPSNYPQIANNIQECNLRRRLWHCIVSIDAYQTALAGTISVLPDQSLVDVQFPMIVTVDPMEHTERDFLIRDSQLNDLYLKLGKMINNVRDKCNLHDLLKLLHQTRTYVDTNFDLNKMTKLSQHQKGSNAWLATLAKNGRSVARSIIQSALELQIYFSLCVNYESNEHLNIVFYKKFFEEIVRAMSSIFDLCAAYLMGDFSEYTAENYNFEILPLVNSAIYRALAACMSGLLRAYHAQELLSTPMYANKRKITAESFDPIIELMTSHAEYMTLIFREKMASKYYQSLKAAAYYKYAFTCLTSHKFKPMNTIIKFLESNDKTDMGDGERMTFSSNRRDDIKKKLQMDKSLVMLQGEWMQVTDFNRSDDQETSQIVNINNCNMFLEFSEEELTQHMRDTIKFKWRKGAVRQAHQEKPEFGFSNVPTEIPTMFDPPNQDQLQNLGANGSLKSFNEFDIFEPNMTDEEFFGKLLDTLDTATLSSDPQAQNGTAGQNQVPQGYHFQPDPDAFM